MSWRTLLTALPGVLLPLPLAWLLYTALSAQEGALPPPPGMDLVPMLTPEERQRLPSYERDCDSDADCEPPLRCFRDMRSLRSDCRDSACTSDQHCAEGLACHPLALARSKAVLYTCLPLGLRREGESCAAHPSSREYACQKGLLCRQGRCGRPCRMDAPSSCPSGFSCQEGALGPSCIPTCENRSCPQGQQCVRRLGNVSICATVHGQDCQRSPCPQGESCSAYDFPRPSDEVWMECLRACGGKNAATCPQGTVCHQAQCFRACTPEDPSACGPGFTCGRHDFREPWRCVPRQPLAP